mmetsp:Transcript_41325/g.76911  ORF Transcript_41325/g.76911 Transcript_41325/m.76911 type:complete len:205 (-) Transcript_41325:48-662(-)
MAAPPGFSGGSGNLSQILSPYLTTSCIASETIPCGSCDGSIAKASSLRASISRESSRSAARTEFQNFEVIMPLEKSFQYPRASASIFCKSDISPMARCMSLYFSRSLSCGGNLHTHCSPTASCACFARSLSFSCWYAWILSSGNAFRGYVGFTPSSSSGSGCLKASQKLIAEDTTRPSAKKTPTANNQTAILREVRWLTCQFCS